MSSCRLLQYLTDFFFYFIYYILIEIIVGILSNTCFHIYTIHTQGDNTAKMYAKQKSTKSVSNCVNVKWSWCKLLMPWQSSKEKCKVTATEVVVFVLLFCWLIITLKQEPEFFLEITKYSFVMFDATKGKACVSLGWHACLTFLLGTGNRRADPTRADDFRPQWCGLWREGQTGEQMDCSVLFCS